VSGSRRPGPAIGSGAWAARAGPAGAFLARRAAGLGAGACAAALGGWTRRLCKMNLAVRGIDADIRWKEA
jgi:hypothetical protein